MKRSFANQLVDRSVTALARVVLIAPEQVVQKDASTDTLVLNTGTELLDTLVLTLDGIEYFELLVRQGDYKFERLPVIEAVFADFSLEHNEILTSRNLENGLINLPFLITSVTDVWAGHEEARFLAAVALSNEASGEAVHIIFEGDEIKIISVDEYNKIISVLPRQYEVLTQHWYN